MANKSSKESQVINETINNTIKQLQNQQDRMIDYLKLKVQEEDWHGVADAAMDIREIVAQKRILIGGKRK